MVATVRVYRHPVLDLHIEVQASDHPAYYRVVMVADATREDVGEAVAVVNDPAELEGLAAQLRQAADTLRHLQERGPLMEPSKRYEADLMLAEPADAEVSHEYEPPRAIDRR